MVGWNRPESVRELRRLSYENSARAHEASAECHEAFANLFDKRGEAHYAEQHRQAAARRLQRADEDRTAAAAL
jgi:hypothetical protein